MIDEFVQSLNIQKEKPSQLKQLESVIMNSIKQKAEEH